MKRYHDELPRTRRVHRTHLREVHGWPHEVVTCPCDTQAGRFRKQKALGCPKRRCICNAHKRFRMKTWREVIADVRAADPSDDAYAL